MMLDIDVITGTCFRSSHFNGLLLPQFILSVFYILIHITYLMEQSQERHINPLRNVSDTYVKIKYSTCVILQLSSGYIKEIFRFYHVIDCHICHSLNFQVHGNFFANKRWRLFLNGKVNIQNK